MSRNIVRRAPPAGRTHIERIEADNFARRLYELMTTQGMSQSDLARAIWGTKKDPRGYDVAKNRDRISAYVRGASIPDPQNMAKLADALGVPVDELAPDVAVDAVSRENPEIALTAVAGHPDKVHLQVYKLVPMGTAVKIIALLDEATKP